MNHIIQNNNPVGLILEGENRQIDQEHEIPAG